MTDVEARLSWRKANIKTIEILRGFDIRILPRKCGWGNPFGFIYNGICWSNSGRRRRIDVEDALGVSSDYLDAIEDMYFANREMFFRHLVERQQGLELAMEEELRELEDELKIQYGLSRDTTLREWRNEHPTSSTDIPQTLIKIEGIRRLDVDEIEPCYVYFLLKGDAVVYVGQTSAPWPQRIRDHIKEGAKEFDDVWYVKVDPLSLNKTEERYIRMLQPKYNKTYR